MDAMVIIVIIVMTILAIKFAEPSASLRVILIALAWNMKKASTLQKIRLGVPAASICQQMNKVCWSLPCRFNNNSTLSLKKANREKCQKIV